MIAYHGKPSVKAKYLQRVRAHRDADALVQGYGYWKDGKGCAVGCTIYGSNHRAYETELGVPLMLAHLEDRIFEGLPKLVARRWPDRFLSAIPVGADLSRVGPAFLVALIARRIEKLTPEPYGVKAAMEQTLTVLRNWVATGERNVPAAAAAAAARSACWAARQKAADDAAYAADADAADAAYAASAAYAYAAYAAADAAYAAYAYADAAYAYASAADAADYAASAARKTEYEWMAETLLNLLRKAPVSP